MYYLSRSDWLYIAPLCGYKGPNKAITLLFACEGVFGQRPGLDLLMATLVSQGDVDDDTEVMTFVKLSHIPTLRYLYKNKSLVAAPAGSLKFKPNQEWTDRVSL